MHKTPNSPPSNGPTALSDGGHHAGSSSTSWCNVGEKPNPTGLGFEARGDEKSTCVDAFSNASLKIALKQIFGAEKKTKSKRFFNMLTLEPGTEVHPMGHSGLNYLLSGI